MLLVSKAETLDTFLAPWCSRGATTCSLKSHRGTPVMACLGQWDTINKPQVPPPLMGQ